MCCLWRKKDMMKDVPKPLKKKHLRVIKELKKKQKLNSL